MDDLFFSIERDNYDKMLNLMIDQVICDNLPKCDKLSKILRIIMDTINIPRESYCILGSYALRKYREINDIDVDLDTQHFTKLKNLSIGNISTVKDENVWTFHKKYEGVDYKIEIYEVNSEIGYPDDSFSLNNLFSTADYLEMDDFGHYCYKLATLKNWKTIVCREKDKDDILLINNILNKQVV